MELITPLTFSPVDGNIRMKVEAPRGASGQLSLGAAIFLEGHETLMEPESIMTPAASQSPAPPPCSALE
ncbi:hypothetical protein E2C01_015503 [Portunus trituberculatus]|uniref:Uncharacterized protein n=1 Tax=Portunus trituberculatus TaxID=210409 RepID=A0A5B7DMY8_PORTR|nr:hypothetical protein [Portunus trituberculatus]